MSKGILQSFLSFGVALCFGCAICICHAQDADVSAILHPDMQALEVKLEGARHVKLKPKGDFYETWCNKEGAERQSGGCLSIANRLQKELGDSAPLVETAFLKSCGIPHNLWGPCSELAKLYETRNEYGLTMAVASSSHCGEDDSGEEAVRCLETKLDIYKRFGLRAEQELTLIALCHGVKGQTMSGDKILLMTRSTAVLTPCQQLQAMGSKANIAELERESDEEFHTQMAWYATRREQQDQATASGNDRKSTADYIVGAISGTSASTTPVYVPSTPPPQAHQSSLGAAPSETSPSNSCRDMKACMAITANYDRDKILHVNVTNKCNERIRASVSVYEQGRSCTGGQTVNLNPGETSDMGNLTPRNWYSAQADDSVDESRTGQGCKLVIPTACDQ